jgi:sugar O-acyltransferase (sialic acid O-acetyltransferase NeuD family)
VRQALVLVGGGGHSISCIDVIESTGKYKIEGIIDKPERVGEKVEGYLIVGTDKDIESLNHNNLGFVITIGHVRESKLREAVFCRLMNMKVHLPNIISPFAYISSNVQMGIGNMVMHQAVINRGTVIGSACIVNTKALLEHDVNIGDLNHISTGAILNGKVQLGNRIFVGSGAIVNNNLSIHDGTTVGAGSVIIESISKPGIYVGIPARRIKDA